MVDKPHKNKNAYRTQDSAEQMLFPDSENNVEHEEEDSDQQEYKFTHKHKVSLRGKWKRTATYNKFIAVAAIVSAASTLAYAIFAMLQWGAMNAQLSEIRKGSADTHELAVQAKNQAYRTKDVADNALTQANATNSLAKEAKRSADAADKNLSLAKNNFILDQRPYMWAKQEAPLIEVDKPIKWGVRFQNYGRSPAFNVHTCIILWYGMSPMKDISDKSIADKCSHLEGPHSSFVVPPGADVFTTAVSEGSIDSDAAEILRHDFRLILTGRITYRDNAGKSYVSTFCAAHLATGASMACEKFNEIK